MQKGCSDQAQGCSKYGQMIPFGIFPLLVFLDDANVKKKKRKEIESVLNFCAHLRIEH